MTDQGYSPASPSKDTPLETPCPSPAPAVPGVQFGTELEIASESSGSGFGQSQNEAVDLPNHQVHPEMVGGPNTGWRSRLYEKDGQRDEYERALLDFLAEDRRSPF